MIAMYVTLMADVSAVLAKTALMFPEEAGPPPTTEPTDPADLAPAVPCPAPPPLPLVMEVELLRPQPAPPPLPLVQEVELRELLEEGHIGLIKNKQWNSSMGKRVDDWLQSSFVSKGEKLVRRQDLPAEASVPTPAAACPDCRRPLSSSRFRLFGTSTRR